ncbi:MAG: peroxiredoxin [Oscillospiraceae bacterium]|jgi:peroxiredoxin (alkyl hydroperoxide reductase subunit C)|nr:peroxiredoxin [Oscillospiraceae bacterium]
MEENAVRFPLIGDPAPAFKAVTTNGEIHFPADFEGKWVILFSHPSDFTPVCTTEFMTFGSLADEFRAMNCELVGLSVDSLASHIAWLRAIETLTWKDKAHVKVRFPLIADIRMEVANKYGMMQPNFSTTAAVRAVFVIDPKGTVRTVLYYPGSLGRNFDEIKRILQGLQKADANACATPADWRPGDDVILPIPGTMEGAQKRIEHPGEGAYCLDWFLCFKKDV